MLRREPIILLLHKITNLTMISIFSEFGNTGAGSSTAGRKTYTPISAAILKSTVLGSDWGSWTDTTY
jgi:hypothetical protein